MMDRIYADTSTYDGFLTKSEDGEEYFLNDLFVKLTNKVFRYKIPGMETLTVGEVKTHFSEVLMRVQKGEKIKILYGKARKPIALIVPVEDLSSARKIGAFDGKASFSVEGTGKITEEEFLGL
jgi:antitoxin (DNA-binding transcriptional repressor) of toxin-antitoxin stability system